MWSLRQSVSHDPSETIIIWWFLFLIIINVENGCAASYFCGNHDTIFLRIIIFFDESSKEHLQFI